MSLAEIAAGLRAVLEQIKRQRAVLAAARSSVREEYQRLLAISTGANHALVHRALTAASTAIERVHNADQQLAVVPSQSASTGRSSVLT
ncbi:hypothetical protein [Micromonospora sp. NBC_01796]|uniref:hypothetical protein n=1 Tax=Micromonospora sp. NBC_01796 TaxID=2975987 RepID=UPI002DDADECE|nr:hypothetical protein [Micromonospora sp. NBC_01796]WSA86357.1 hypothetical protein OIE47_01680 [Micromonospora sp. NBC_01796]